MATAAVVHESSAKRIDRIAFGSCNKQFKPQPLWPVISAFKPDLYLWMGDAVYLKAEGTLAMLREALETQHAVPAYQDFLQSGVKVVGVWDDHDRGINDAGKEGVDSAEARKDAFLDFLDAPADDARRRVGTETLYASYDFGEAPQKVRVILLDTRAQRDQFCLANFSDWKRYLPLATFMGVFSRWISSLLCLCRNFEGDVLGEDQWRWLEKNLEGSDAAFHVLVSSVQVHSSIPLLESWGHFPAAKRRLLTLLQRTRPRGLITLSGDVHFAELHQATLEGKCAAAADNTLAQTGAYSEPKVVAEQKAAAEKTGHFGEAQNARKPAVSDTDVAAKDVTKGVTEAAVTDAGVSERQRLVKSVPRAENDPRRVVELTTSGMTHTCGLSYGEERCTKLLKSNYKTHRVAGGDALFMGLNWGSIEIDWKDNEAENHPVGCEMCPQVEGASQVQVCRAVAQASVRDKEGKRVLGYALSSCDRHRTDDILRCGAAFLEECSLADAAKTVAVAVTAVSFLLFATFGSIRRCQRRHRNRNGRNPSDFGGRKDS